MKRPGEFHNYGGVVIFQVITSILSSYVGGIPLLMNLGEKSPPHSKEEEAHEIVYPAFLTARALAWDPS